MTVVDTGPVWGRSRRRPPTQAPPSADVVVIGGGITGVSLLHWLQRYRLRAVLLERDHLAAGASLRNAGFLLAGTAANYAAAVAQYGRDVAGEVWCFTLENHSRCAALLASRRTGYRRCGSWTVAASGEEAAQLREAEQLLREDRLRAEWQQHPAGVAGAGHGALFNPDDGVLDPVAAVAALADLAPAASIVEGIAVRAVEPSGGRVRVDAGSIEITAGAVIAATNAATAQLLPGVAIRPVRAQMLATAPWPHRVASRPAYAHWGFRYWRQLDDGRLLVGGQRDRAVDDEVGHQAVPTATVQEHLDAHLSELATGAAVTHRWAGIMGFSDDGLPRAGAVPGMANVYVCGGYTGHGLGFALSAAGATVRLMVEGRAPPPWLDSRRPSLTSQPR